MKKLQAREERTGDRQVDQAQRNLGDVREAFNKSAIARGRLAFDTDAKVAEIDFTAATAKRILHGLALPSGATPAGWIVADTDAAAIFHRTAWDSQSVTLVASVDCTARIWVFP